MDSTSNVEEGSTKPIKRTSRYPTSGAEVEYYYSGRPLDARHKAIVRWITFILFIVVFLYGAFAFYIRKTTPLLPKFEVESFTLMPLGVSSGISNASSIWMWNIDYFIQDPDDNMDVTYNDVSIEVFYKNLSVGMREVHPFHQDNGVRDSRHLQFTTYVSLDQQSSTFMVQNMIFDDRAKQTVLAFDVKIYVNATYRNVWSGLNTDQHAIVGCCKDLSIDYAEDPKQGNLKGGTQTCQSILEDD